MCRQPRARKALVWLRTLCCLIDADAPVDGNVYVHLFNLLSQSRSDAILYTLNHYHPVICCTLIAKPYPSQNLSIVLVARIHCRMLVSAAGLGSATVYLPHRSGFDK